MNNYSQKIEAYLFNFHYTGGKVKSMITDECIFCKIIKGSIKADIIGETETALAFKDIKPQADTHVLVIPKLHIASTRELNQSNIVYLSEMIFLSNKIADKEGILNSGYRWIVNTGDHGGQTVDHLHLHLLGGRQMLWPPG